MEVKVTNQELFDRMNEFAAEANDNAVKHGWWEGERDNRELIALIHSEISEALEEYRAKRPLVWINDAFETADSPKKPEGIAIELIDMAIRIADFMGHYGLKFGGIEEYEDCSEDTASILCCKLHGMLGDLCFDGDIDWVAGSIEDEEYVSKRMTEMVAVAFNWIEGNGKDPWKLLYQKHEFNKQRSFRHGNKVC